MCLFTWLCWALVVAHRIFYLHCSMWDLAPYQGTKPGCPALGTLLYTPHSPSGITFFFFFFFWWSYRLSSDINFFFPPHPHSLSQLTLGGKKYRRSPGHQASSSFYQHLIHHCSFFFFFSPCRICGVFNICNCFFVKRNSQRKTQLTTQERKDGSHVSHGHCEAFLVLGSPEFLTPRRHKHSLKP